METITLKEYPEIKAVIQRVGSYRKLKAFLSITDRVTPHGTYWDGGSRSCYFHIRKDGVVHVVPAPTAPPQFGGGEPQRFNIPAGDYVVCTGTFRGKTAFAHVYHNK